jgi:GTP-binding protein
MRAPNSALEVELDDGNQTGYSRHRQPEEAPRIRPIRRTESTDPFRDARAEKEKLSITAPEKRQAYTRLENPELQGCHWYWETVAPTIAQKAQATHFFLDGKPPKFLRSVAIFRAFPESDVPEVAFVGRSNVGKSSLLNAIVNANTKALLAKTSATPGFTKTMNLYGVGPGNGVNIIKDATSGHDKVVGAGGITIVDMPGYGEGSLSEWGYEIMKYLQGRKQLRRVFVLLDAQHGIKDKDRSLLAALRLGGISHQIILSKLDKIYIPKADSIKHVDGKSVSKWKPKGSLKHLQDVMKGIRAEVNPPVGGGALGEILGCSSELLVDKKRLGLDAVRFAILQAADLQLRVKPEKKKDQSRLVRTMKVGRARDALDAL